MSRIPTSYYGADPTTTFAWATTDNDRFDRAQDLYNLAQAVEHHDHSSGRGLAVARIAANAITEAMFLAQSVSTRALADLSVTGAKIAAGTITDDKVAIPKMPLAGGVMTGNLQLIPTGAPTTGYFYPGNTGSYFGFDGSSVIISHVTGGRIYALGDLTVQRPAAATTGFVFLGNAGNYLGFDGSNFVASGQLIRTSLNTVDAPLGGMVAFRTLAELTAAGARWARETTANGRLLVGAGQAGGIAEVFAENTFYGTTWAPLTYMGYGVNAGTLAVTPVVVGASTTTPNVVQAGGAGNAAAPTHDHPVSGGALTGVLAQVNAGQSFLPPSLGVIWGRRTS